MQDDYIKVLEYLKQHIADYSGNEAQSIALNFNMKRYSDYLPDVLRQIYDEVGILKDKDNIYLGFIDILENNFDIDSNILEVGGGVIPNLAKHINLKQTKGSITVYDPRLSISSTSTSFILKKEVFTPNTDISNYNIIIGLMPCEATELIIRKATSSKKDFLIALCDGRHSEFLDYFDEELWCNNIIKLADKHIKENDLGTLCITDLKKYGDPYPVIYNKRKKLSKL